MATINPMFWTDFDQAVERLSGSWVLFEGYPVFVHDIRNHKDKICARVIPAGKHNEVKHIPLDHPGFNLFRALPPSGWYNVNWEGKDYAAVYTARNPARTRTHGLSRNNMRLYDLVEGSLLPNQNYTINEVFHDSLACTMSYPSLEECMVELPESMSIAFSVRNALSRDALGLRYFYRDNTKIGVFTSHDTLSLPPKFSFYKEELAEDPTLSAVTIKEF